METRLQTSTSEVTANQKGGQNNRNTNLQLIIPIKIIIIIMNYTNDINKDKKITMIRIMITTTTTIIIMMIIIMILCIENNNRLLFITEVR